MHNAQRDKLNIEPEGARGLKMTRMFEAPRDLVFFAFTTPQLVQRWLLGPEGWTMPVCEIDLRAGGQYYYMWRNAEGEEMHVTGRYSEVAPPQKLVSTERFAENWTGGATTVTLDFIEVGPERTQVIQTILFVSAEARDGALGTGMSSGVECGFVRLDALLTEPALKSMARSRKEIDP